MLIPGACIVTAHSFRLCRPDGKDHLTYIDWIRFLDAMERRDLIEEAKKEAAANGIELKEREFNV